jgi:hypothetical protein
MWRLQRFGSGILWRGGEEATGGSAMARSDLNGQRIEGGGGGAGDQLRR